MDNEIIDTRLEIANYFQNLIIGSHIGGSLGLFLHGIVVNREIGDIDLICASYSDIDFIDKYCPEIERVSDTSDFAACYLYKDTAIDISIQPQMNYFSKVYLGTRYKVSMLHDIIHFKKKYAYKGIEKHKQDLFDIVTGGDFPIEYSPVIQKDDGLPF